VISPTKRPLPHNTQQLQETDSHVQAVFEPVFSASEKTQNHTLENAVAGIGSTCCF
jgi:hypothetical protein